jgi:hypothetical protein
MLADCKQTFELLTFVLVNPRLLLRVCARTQRLGDVTAVIEERANVNLVLDCSQPISHFCCFAFALRTVSKHKRTIER